MSEEKVNELEKLFSLFTTEDIESLRGEDYMNEAIDELERISQDEHIIELYNLEQKERERCDMIVKHEKKVSKEEGMKVATIEIAKKMLEKNTDIEYIIDVTGLSKEEIEKL